MTEKTTAAPEAPVQAASSRRTRLVIIGGGIAGLSAAHAAVKQATSQSLDLEVVVLERDDQVGGKAKSFREGEWLVEGGPVAYMDTEPEFAALIEEVGLADSRMRAHDAAIRRFLYQDEQLREVAFNPIALVRNGIMSLPGILRVAREPWIGRREDGVEESLRDFCARRFGNELADRMVMPMALGIFAGDARHLSARAAFPKLTDFERDHGSILRGMIARRRAARKSEKAAAAARGVKPIKASKSALTSFPGGIQTLPLRLAENPAIEVRCGQVVSRVERTESGEFVIRLIDGSTLAAHSVVVAAEPWATADMIPDLAPRLVSRLREIVCPPVSVVALGYDAEVAASAPTGFGALIPRGEGVRILGTLWETSFFDHRGPKNQLLVRAMLGGGVDPDVGGLSAEETLELAISEVNRTLGISARPIYTKVIQWPRAIPQYDLGHPERMEEIERELESIPGLFLSGNGLRGVSFPQASLDGMLQGRRAVESLVQALETT